MDYSEDEDQVMENPQVVPASQLTHHLHHSTEVAQNNDLDSSNEVPDLSNDSAVGFQFFPL